MKEESAATEASTEEDPGPAIVCEEAVKKEMRKLEEASDAEYALWIKGLKERGVEVETLGPESDDDTRERDQCRAMAKESMLRKAEKIVRRNDARRKNYTEALAPLRANARRQKYEDGRIIPLGGVGPLTPEEKAIIKRYSHAQAKARYRAKKKKE